MSAVEGARIMVSNFEALIASEMKVLASLRLALKTAQAELQSLEKTEEAAAKQARRIEGMQIEWVLRVLPKDEEQEAEVFYAQSLDELVPDIGSEMLRSQSEISLSLHWYEMDGEFVEKDLFSTSVRRWPTPAIRRQWTVFQVQHPDLFEFLRTSHARQTGGVS